MFEVLFSGYIPLFLSVKNYIDDKVTFNNIGGGEENPLKYNDIIYEQRLSGVKQPNQIMLLYFSVGNSMLVLYQQLHLFFTYLPL